MLYNLTPISGILFLNSFFLIFLGVYLWRRGTYYFFSLLMFAAALWAFCAAFGNGALNLSDNILWSKMAYVGINSIAPTWFLFSLQYAQFQKKLIRRFNYFIWIVPAILFVITITNEWHGLFWTKIEPTVAGVIYTRGMAVYASMVYAYILILLGMAVLINYALKTTKNQKFQIFTLLFGIFFPWLFNFFYLSSASIVTQTVDLTPVAFAATGIFASLSIFKYKLLAVVPAAKELVYSSLEAGVIVVDNESMVVNFNPMAKKLIKDSLVNGVAADQVSLTNKLTLKKIIDDKKNRIICFLESNICLDIRTNDLKDQFGHLLGRTILLYDITAQKDIEQKLAESSRFFSDLTDFLPDSIFAINVERKVVFWNKAMEKLTGVLAKDMLGKGNYEYALPFYGERRPLLLDLVLNNNPNDEAWKLFKKEKIEKLGDLMTMEIFNKIVKKEGAHFLVLTQPIFDSNGKIIYAVESIRDVSDTYQHQEELKAKIEELSAMNKVMVNRELKMIGLKEELNAIKAKKTSK